MGNAVGGTVVTTLRQVGRSGSTQQHRGVEADSERLVLIDAISRAVQAIPTERPMVVVLDDDPEPDPSSPLVLRVFPMGLATTGDGPGRSSRTSSQAQLV